MRLFRTEEDGGRMEGRRRKMGSTQERFEMPFKRRRRKGERSSSLARQVTINRTRI